MSEREIAIFRCGQYTGQAVEILMNWFPGTEHSNNDLDRVAHLSQQIRMEAAKAGWSKAT